MNVAADTTVYDRMGLREWRVCGTRHETPYEVSIAAYSHAGAVRVGQSLYGLEITSCVLIDSPKPAPPPSCT